MAKNAGKTTVLNKIIEELEAESFAITSIGLDGEKIDNVTNKPKPRIKVHENMIIATAESCLNECTFTYQIHEKTNITTALGKIIIIEATSDGLCLLAGPSTKNEMIQVVSMLKKYGPKHILIDGALFRKSIAASRVSDAIILATGASYNNNMNIVINDTKALIDQLSLECADSDIIKVFKQKKSNLLIDINDKVKKIDNFWNKTSKNTISNSLEKDSKSLILQGALTNSIVDELVDVRHKISKLDLIVQDATHILCGYENYKKLALLNVRVKVMNQIQVLFVTLNPITPYGLGFDKTLFKSKLENSINKTCINVLEE